MIDLGDTVVLTATVVDADGNPANADTPTLTITLPDGTEVAPAPEPANPPEQPGQYRYPYVTTEPGLHRVRWTFTGTVPDQAHTDVFSVLPEAPPYIISLQAARKQLQMTNHDEDDQLRLFVESATAVIENHAEFGVGPVVRRTVTERQAGRSADRLLLDHYPVIGVTSVTGVRSDVAYDPEDLVVDKETGIVELADGRRIVGGPWQVVYEAGRLVVPANITLAAQIIVQHLWSTRRPRDVRRPPVAQIGDLTDRSATGMPPGATFSIPRKAVELLAGFVRAKRYS